MPGKEAEMVGGQSQQLKKIILRCIAGDFTKEFPLEDYSEAEAAYRAGLYSENHFQNNRNGGSVWHACNIYRVVERTTTTITEEKIV